MWEYIFSMLFWWGFTLIKFVLTPFLMINSREWNFGDEHWSWLETIAVTSSGAALWGFVFFHFGEFIFNWMAHHLKAKKKIFNRRNRWIIGVKKRWGLIGLLAISGLLSVPISSVLCAKLYRHNSTALPKLIIAFFVWSVTLSSLAYGMKQIGLQL